MTIYMSQHYELLYIVAGAAGDEAQAGLQQKVADELTKAGAQVTSHTAWESRKFAFPIGKLQQGVYMIAEFDAETESTRTIERGLRLMPEVLRYLMVRKQVKTPEQIEEEKRIREKIQERKVREAHVAAAEAQEKEKKEQRQSEKQQATEQKKDEAQADVPRVSLEELDKKLDEILSDDNI